MTPHLTQCPYAIIEVPSVLGLKPTGVERLPQALLENRLAERVDARHAGRVEPLPYSDERDAATGRLPDGFSRIEATSILKVALASGRAVGMEVTVYNPALDEDGKAALELTNVLAAALGTSAPWNIRE